MQKFYAGIKQVTAVFRQSVTNDTFGSTKTSDGTVWLMKPGKMRWDYVEKKKGKVQVKKSFISNGSFLYVVEHANKQVVKKNLANDLMPVAVSFLYGKGDLKAEFNAVIETASKYGDKDDIVLKMTPKKPSAQYRRHIAALRRQIGSLERQLSVLRTRGLERTPMTAAAADAKGMRFVAKGLRAHRARLALSAAEYGRLVGVSAQTIYSCTPIQFLTAIGAPAML